VTPQESPSIIDTQSKSYLRGYLPNVLSEKPESFRSRTVLDRLSPAARLMPESMLSQFVVLFTDSESSPSQLYSSMLIHLFDLWRKTGLRSTRPAKSNVLRYFIALKMSSDNIKGIFMDGPISRSCPLKGYLFATLFSRRCVTNRAPVMGTKRVWTDLGTGPFLLHLITRVLIHTFQTPNQCLR